MKSSEQERELSSWKDIAQFLQVSVRTAQKWELEKGLPVQRMPGAAGRVSAKADDLTRWKTHTLQNHPWWQRAKFRAYYAVILPVLLAVVLSHEIYFHHLSADHRTPSGYRLELNELVVLDGGGIEMWRRRFTSATMTSRRSTTGAVIDPPVALVDVTGDNHREVLVVGSLEDFGSDVIYCYSGEGMLMWTFEPPGSQDPELGVKSRITSVLLAPNSESSRVQVLVLTCAPHDHDNRLHAIDGAGSATELFRHAGHLDQMARADVDLDGLTEIVLGGIDDATRQASIHLVHLFEEPTSYGAHEAEILLPRIASNRSGGGQNFVTRIVASDGNLYAEVTEWFGQDPFEVSYMLDRQLRPEIWFREPFRMLWNRLQAEGVIERRSVENEITEMKDFFQVHWIPGAL